MPDTSEPAPGSESPKQPRIGSETSGASHSRFCSSVPAIRIGPAARPFAPIEVPIPEHPQLSSSPTSIPSNAESSGPPSDCGMRLVLVVLGRLRTDLLLCELARERPELLLLVGQRERHAVREPGFDRRH